MIPGSIHGLQLSLDKKLADAISIARHDKDEIILQLVADAVKACEDHKVPIASAIELAEIRQHKLNTSVLHNALPIW